MKYEQTDGNAEVWGTVFGPGHPDLKKQHKLHRLLPKNPRCRMCLVPFAGFGGWIMSKRGKSPSSRNQHYCTACDGFLKAFPGGAEVEMSVLFVDIRNSVSIAEGASPTAVSNRVGQFLTEATQVITENDGFIMAFYGDCVVAVWPPGFSGPDHAQKAVSTARLLREIFADNTDTPAGTGVHTGPVYIGTVEAGKGTFRDISIFGHCVNVTARLASIAAPGEALVSTATIKQASLPVKNENKFKLKGLKDTIQAMSV